MIMKKIILIGASGMIGGLVLRKALESDSICEIVSLVRKPLGISRPKLKEIILQNPDWNLYYGIIPAVKHTLCKKNQVRIEQP